ncbi:MAG: histidine phosphatase family protein, partial [Thiohalomonadales bacterium]
LNFSQRIISAWENVINNLQAGEKILLVTHGGSIRVILHHILGLPLSSIMKIHVPYACVSKIVVDLPYHNTTECRLASHAANNTQLAQ